MRRTLILATLVVFAATSAVAGKRIISGGQPFEMYKTVPVGATLEYRINGQLTQALPIQPGTYRISISQVQ